MAPSDLQNPFTVSFCRLDRWGVSSFRSINWQWPANTIQPIGIALDRIKNVVHSNPEDSPIIGKISFSGELSILEKEKRKKYKGRLFRADSGSLIYSKIRVKQGSMCIIPSSVKWVAVSSEYPVYRVNTDLADSKYLELVLRSSPFKRYLDGLAHGGGTKTRIAPDQFEAILIPIPPLPIQQQIVAYWEKAQTKARTLETRAAQLPDELEQQVLAKLGLKKKKRIPMPKVMVSSWPALTKWNQRATYLLRQAPDLRKGKYPVASGRECISEVKHGCSASPSRKPTTLQVLKLSAVTSGRFLSSEAKFMVDKEPFRENFDLIKGDILMCRTNGTLAYVGRPALISKDYPAMIFPDKLMRVRCKDNILPEYLEYILSSSIARPQLEANTRTAVGNHAIGNEDVFNVELPLPPLDVQEALGGAIQKSRNEIATITKEAAELRKQVENKVEKLILGTLSGEKI